VSRRTTVAVVALFAWTVLAVALVAQTAQAGSKEKATRAFEALKSLEGKWAGTAGAGEESNPVEIIYKVTAAGSALMETLMPGTENEMVTVYHMDGDRLMLTHYCAGGNQPRMVLDPDSPEGDLHFRFDGGTNMNSEKDPHMHEATIHIGDAGRLECEWVGFNEGKQSETMAFSLTRSSE
jgi:hypothetical protein